MLLAMRRQRSWAPWPLAHACLALLSSCFGGEFLAGIPCQSDRDCGPQLGCIDGVCGTAAAETGSESETGTNEVVCGDGKLEEGEECDDANLDDTDLCTTACKLAICGDGYIGPGEGCDDGNLIDGDGCDGDCIPATCGNGKVEFDEQCDDGNDNNEDSCIDTCALASCGDGYKFKFNEDCDDGNLDDHDNCSSCKDPTCHDDVRNQGESDIDCGDPCAARCPAGAMCDADEDCGSGGCTDSMCEVRASVEAGHEHTCALYDGLVHCWGAAYYGELGLATTEAIGNDEHPNSRPAVSIGGPVAAIATGRLYSCAILHTGEARCWGDGSDGKLGLGTTDNTGDDEYPIDKRALTIGPDAARAVEFALALSHTCARVETNELYCWGRSYGFFGLLGDPDLGQLFDAGLALPVDIGGTPVIDVTAQYESTCVLLQGGGVRCWGNNSDTAPIGYPGGAAVIGDQNPPASLDDIDIGGTATQIAGGASHVCALLSTGDITCWGSNEFGQLGYGHVTPVGDDETPAMAGTVNVDGVGGTVVQISAGDEHTCARLEGGSIRCWGNGTGGRLGYGNSNTIGDDELPAMAGDVNVGDNVLHISAGGKHTCALLSGGRVRCWGENTNGQLGYGNTLAIGDDEVPAVAGDVQYR